MHCRYIFFRVTEAYIHHTRYCQSALYIMYILITHFQIRFKVIWNRSREGILKWLRERSTIFWQQRTTSCFPAQIKHLFINVYGNVKNRVGVISFKHKIGTRSKRELVIQNLTWLKSPSNFNQFNSVQKKQGKKKSSCFKMDPSSLMDIAWQSTGVPMQCKNSACWT